MKKNNWIETILLFNKARIYLETKEEWSNKIKDILCIEFIIYMIGAVGYLLKSTLSLFWNSLVIPLLKHFIILFKSIENDNQVVTPLSLF